MDFSNKRILYMGDSITAGGAWVARFNEIIKPMAFVNIAVGGARWQDNEKTVYDGNPKLTEDNINNTICNQLEKLLRGKDDTHENYSCVTDYEDFDIIIVSAGTNDGPVKGLYEGREETIRSQFFNEDKGVVPLSEVDRKTWPGAMRVAYETLKRLYPNADIFYCTPIQGAQTSRAYETIKAKRDYIKEICDRLSDVTVIDTFKCGICGLFEITKENGRDLKDGLHPNASGAEKIARYNAREIKKFYL